ncbi:MAG TPA: acetyl-CoA hydrolase/transferase C-terminal domain-containing protein [Dehalococcoidia bacterium]|nr:acetyl-CoA hydrolase/transferase C-terminal domain-containing protein [Dehalococcoidia bacterium]
MDWKSRYGNKVISEDEAANLIKPGHHVVLSLCPRPVPPKMAKALLERREKLRHVSMTTTWYGDYPWYQPGMEEIFRVCTSFVTPFVREGARQRRIETFFWVPGLGNGERQQDTNRGRIHQFADVCFAVVTPPDADGYCSFGHSVWWLPTAVRTARLAVGLVDETLPHTFGDRVSVDDLHYLVPLEGPVPDFRAGSVTAGHQWEQAQVVGAFASELVRDGDTLQIGFGAPSESVIPFLTAKNDLGIDTEMLYPSLYPLYEAGNITNARKSVNRGKTIATGMTPVEGDPNWERFKCLVHRNPDFEFRDISYICHVPRIAANNNMVAINTAVGIDLYGQVAVDQWQGLIIGGIGGQLEYTVGSHYSRGGRAVTCLLSTTPEGKSRIVPKLPEDSLVTIPAGYVDYLVTEYGVVNLEFKTRKERAEAIISVAHPDFRSELMKEARKMFWP